MLLLLACAPQATSPPPPSCDAPVRGLDRFVDEAGARGLGADHAPFWGGETSMGRNVLLEDLDGDGDVDVALGRVEGPPDLYANDGAGRFAAAPPPFPDTVDTRGPVGGVGLADLDADGLPDLVFTGAGRIWAARNLGDLAFDAPETLYADEGDVVPWYVTFSAGDLDGDGDLDLVVPGLDQVSSRLDAPADPSTIGQPTVTLALENPSWTVTRLNEDAPTMAMLAAITDRDGDGDGDVLVSTDRLYSPEWPAKQAFYRNDDGRLVDDAAAVGADLYVAGMGLDAVDLNGDGALDYCITDTGPVRCLLSDGEGRYYDGGRALGLEPAAMADGTVWVGWSIELADLDNDGWLDAVAAGGNELHPRMVWPAWQDVPPSPYDDAETWADVVWAGGEDGFEDVTAATRLGDTANHYGLAAADLDGDGWLEVVTAGAAGPPRAWWNRCGDGRWLGVALDGPPGNPAGIGAIVEVTAGGRTVTRQVQALRGFGQAPARLHFGVGDAVSAEVRVRWPDGTTSGPEAVATRRVVAVEWRP